jgi:hypothetical protein
MSNITGMRLSQTEFITRYVMYAAGTGRTYADVHRHDTPHNETHEDAAVRAYMVAQEMLDEALADESCEC